MTHTEESLMALADEYARFGDWTGGKPVINEGNERDALRLAIREVLAERDAEGKLRERTADQLARVIVRAERAEAEVERLRKDAARLDHIEKHARCDPKMDGHHVWWPTTFNNALRGCNLREAIDAAIEQDRSK